MRLSRRVLVWSLAVVIVIAGGTWAGFAIHDHVVYGTVVGEDQKTLTVTEGDRFSIAVRDLGGSVGDEWSATLTPADAVTLVHNRMVISNWFERHGIGPETSGGGAGTRYFTYLATKPGTVSVQLTNCFQGRCRVTEIPDPYSRTVTWTITID